MKKIIMLFFLAAAVTAYANDVKKDWVVACSKDKFTDEASCTSTKLFPEWQGAKPEIPITITRSKVSTFVSFSFHNHPLKPAKIRIDNHQAFIQNTNIISGERAKDLIAQMKTGTKGKAITEVWPDLTYEFDFSLTGLAESIQELETSFKSFK